MTTQLVANRSGQVLPIIDENEYSFTSQDLYTGEPIKLSKNVWQKADLIHIKFYIKEKLKYFAQYLNIGFVQHYDFTLLLESVDLDVLEVNDYNAEPAKLVLSPLSKLTPEDAKITFGCNGFISTNGYTFTPIGSNYQQDIKLSEWQTLKELGYAIPVNGIYNPFFYQYCITKEANENGNW